MVRLKLVLGSFPREEAHTNGGFRFREDIADEVIAKAFDGSVWFQYRTEGSASKKVQLVNSSSIPFKEGTVQWFEIPGVGDVVSAQVYVVRWGSRHMGWR